MAEALGLASSIIAVFDLFIKVGVQCSIYCSGLKNAPHEIRQVLNEADTFTATLKNLERLLAGPNGARLDSSEKIRRSVGDCYLQLVDLTTKLDQGTRLQRITWPLKKREMVRIIEQLQRYRATITLDLQIGQSELLFNIHQEVVLGKLNSAKGAAFDSPSHVDSYMCHPGTRCNILDKIIAWGSAPDGHCIFWLNGGAGTGKSTISRTVAQSFASKGMLGGSFFFKRGEADRGNMALFFPTMASQLAQSFPMTAPHIRAAAETNPNIHDKPIKEQFDKLFASPVENISEHSELPTIVLVADALDECDNAEHVRLVIQLLSQAQRFTSVRLKVFLTSRPELPIRLGFEDIYGQYEDMVLHQVPRVVIEHDIALFLEYQFDKIRQDYNKSVSSNRQLPLSWPSTEEFQHLVSRSVPLFIFAATVCRFVQDRRIGGPKEQLAKILEHKTGHVSSLDATYLPIVHGLVAGLSDSEMRQVSKRFKQIVGSIILLESPLSIPSLARLLNISPDAIEDLLDFLHSVLHVPSDPITPIRLLHLSFRDFLVDPEKAEGSERYPFWIDEQNTHQNIATVCLQLLSTSDTLRRNVCSLKFPGAMLSKIDKQSINAALPPEVQYACRYWVHHWKEGKSKIKDGGLVDHFLTSHLLHWIEAIALLGRLSEFTAMIYDLLGLLDTEQSALTSALLRDTRRIILSHGAIISISPLQIYYSAIVFAPEKSIIKTKFRNESPAWLSLSPQVATEWDACLQTLEGHSSSAKCVAFSHDSKMLASGSFDSTIKLWDLATGACSLTLEGHDRPVYSIAFSHDSKELASASSDRTIRLWNTVTGFCTAILEGHRWYPSSVAFSHDSKELASASYDGAIKFWDTTTRMCTTTLEAHSAPVSSISFSQNSKSLASASSDRTIKLWDTATKTCTATIEEAHSDAISSVAFSHDSRVLASASRDESIKLWDPATGTCMVTFHGYGSIAFSHDSKVLASACDDCGIKMWDVATSRTVKRFKGHNGAVEAVAFSHDSKLLASVSDGDSTIKVWDVESDVDENAPINFDDNVIESLQFVNAKALLSVSSDGTIRLWNASTGTCTATLKGCSGWGDNSIARSHNSEVLAFPPASSNGKIRLWDIKMGTDIATLEGHDSTISSAPQEFDLQSMPPMFEKDGQRYMKYWNRSKGYLQTNAWTTSVVSAVVFSHDSRLLASASAVDGIIKVWDVESNTCTAILKGHSNWISWLAFLPHSTVLVSSAADGNIRIWDIDTCICTATLEGRSDVTNPISFSHNYKMLASGLSDGGINILEISTGAFKVIPGSDEICSIAFSQNSTLLASLSSRSSGPEWFLKFWDVATGFCSAVVNVSPLAENYLSFQGTEYTLFTSIGNFTLEVPADPEVNSHLLSIDDRIHCRGIGLSEDSSWVMWDDDKMIWLPPAYRPFGVAVLESTLAIGCSGTHITLLTISPSLLHPF